MKTFLLNIIQGIWYFLATIIISAAVLVSVARFLTPLLNNHRVEFETWASDLLHVPIVIGEIHADWRGYVPEVTFTHVVILEKQTRKPAFEIEEIRMGLQLLSSLWQRKMVLHDVILSGASVSILEDVSGKYYIKDLPTQEEKGYKTYQLVDILKWASSQSYLSFRQIEIYFFPFKAERRWVTINKISLSNRDGNHKLMGSLILNQEIPTQVTAHIDWIGNLTQPEQIKAQGYFNLEGFSLSQWLQEKTFSGWQIRDGIGGADIWFTWEKRQWQEIQSIFQWYNLAFYSELEKKIYLIPRLSGHLGWKKEGEKQIFAGDNILINFPQHFWPATTFYVAVTPTLMAGTANHATSWHLNELRLGYLNLQDIQPILLANLSVSSDLRKKMIELHSSGEIQDVKINWQGNLTDFTKTSLTGKFNELSFFALQKFPGISNLSGSLQWNGRAGRLRLSSQALTFIFGSIFAGPLAFDKVIGDITFQHNNKGGWSFVVPNGQLYNADMSASGSVKMIFPPQSSPTIDLHATFLLAKAGHITRYLPLSIFDPDLVKWLKNAFLDGRIESGEAVVQGKLSDFPFKEEDNHKTGIFQISGDLKDIEFNYAPRWPLMHQVNGQLTFTGQSMTAVSDSAYIMDIPLSHIKGNIPSLGSDKVHVDVQGNIDTDLTQGLDFIHKSPLQQTIGKDLAGIQMKGPMKLNLSLSIPLSHPEKAKVLGEAQVEQSTLAFPAWDVSLDQLQGGFRFTDREIRAKLLQGILWGQPTTLKLSTVQASKRKNASYVQADLTGKIDIAQLQSSFNLPLSDFLSGSAAYQAQLKLYEAESSNNTISIHSNLQDIAVDLPEPYGKVASTMRDFLFVLNIKQSPQLKTQLKYGNLIRAQLNMTREKDSRVIEINSSQLQGKVRVAYPFDAKQPIQAQLDKIIVARNDTKTISSLKPQRLPPLIITSKQFFYGDKNLGQLYLNTMPKANGLTIQNFNLSDVDYTFTSSGQWTAEGREQQTQLQGTITSSRVNQFLEKIGLPLPSLVVNKGQAAFDLKWKGPPYGFGLATMTGDFSFALERGRIINLNESNNQKMDLGRMLSVFSLQTIPRRLSLDFSDLVEKGYSFDYMLGDFTLKNGNAFIKKEAIFDGPVAHVSARGRIGLLAHDYNLILSVSPYVTESLPVVAGAITLNPFVGAAAWLVNKMVLSNEVSKVITYNYTVTGPWNNPTWSSTSQ